VSETIIASVVSAFLGGFVGAASALAVEKYRSRLEDRARFNQSQFDSYRSLWVNLFDLKEAADRLWKVANLDNLKTFAGQLQKTEIIVGQNSPFIEEIHKRELDSLMETFGNFRFGKERLHN
jgi:hypothetical protein